MSIVRIPCRDCKKTFEKDKRSHRVLCDTCRVFSENKTQRRHSEEQNGPDTRKIETSRGYSLSDLQWSNPERFARQVNSITSGVKELHAALKGASPADELIDIKISDPLHQKDTSLSCDAALVVYVKCDHTIHSGSVGSLELLERLRKYAAMNPTRVFGAQDDEVRWFCRLELEPTSMKNGKINGRWLSKEARRFKKDAPRMMEHDGVWQAGKQFAENDLIRMTCYVRYSSFRKDMDLELVKDCLQLAKIVPNDKMIFEEDFVRDQKTGKPEILITLRKIGVASWK